MATLEQIKRENERLRNQLKAKHEMLEIGSKRGIGSLPLCYKPF